MGGRVASPTFIGRVEELHALEAAKERAANGEPAVVLVGGEAGVGKTRLLTQLAGSWVAEGTRVLAGGCVPVGDGALPYAPIVEALRPLPAELGADAVRELAGPSWPELARVLPGLGEPPGEQPGQAAKTRLFELLLGLLTRLGEQAPVTLVVEDLHWADPLHPRPVGLPGPQPTARAAAGSGELPQRRAGHGLAGALPSHPGQEWPRPACCAA
jgi:predicted ATPase